MNQTKTIQVTGKGLLKVKPDTLRITMTLSAVHKEYSHASEAARMDTETVKHALVDLGLNLADIRTKDFSIRTEHESYRIRDEYRERHIGYRYTHVLKVEFPIDSNLTGPVLHCLSSGPVRPNLEIGYTVKDPEAVRNELLVRAIDDARQKADILARASGCMLGEVLSIDYSWQNVTMDLYLKPIQHMNSLQDEALSSIIEPDDLQTTDTVTVVWALTAP